MKEAHVSARPTVDSLCAMFPRHSRTAVQIRAGSLGLRTPVKPAKPIPYYLRWLRIAHEHFARRESGLLA